MPVPLRPAVLEQRRNGRVLTAYDALTARVPTRRGSLCCCGRLVAQRARVRHHHPVTWRRRCLPAAVARGPATPVWPTCRSGLPGVGARPVLTPPAVKAAPTPSLWRAGAARPRRSADDRGRPGHGPLATPPCGQFLRRRWSGPRPGGAAAARRPRPPGGLLLRHRLEAIPAELFARLPAVGCHHRDRAGPRSTASAGHPRPPV